MPEPDDWLPRCPSCDTPCPEYVAKAAPTLYRCLCPACSTPFWVEEVPKAAPKRPTVAADPGGDYLSPKLRRLLRRRRSAKS